MERAPPFGGYVGHRGWDPGGLDHERRPWMTMWGVIRGLPKREATAQGQSLPGTSRWSHSHVETPPSASRARSYVGGQAVGVRTTIKEDAKTALRAALALL